MRNKAVACTKKRSYVMRMQVFSVRTTCRTHQARATTAVRRKFEQTTCMPCSLAVLSQRSTAGAVSFTITLKSRTYLRHCDDRIVPVNKTAQGRLRSGSRSTCKFAVRSKGEATPETLAQVHHLLELGISVGTGAVERLTY